MTSGSSTSGTSSSISSHRPSGGNNYFDEGSRINRALPLPTPPQANSRSSTFYEQPRYGVPPALPFQSSASQSNLPPPLRSPLDIQSGAASSSLVQSTKPASNNTGTTPTAKFSSISIHDFGNEGWPPSPAFVQEEAYELITNNLAGTQIEGPYGPQQSPRSPQTASDQKDGGVSPAFNLLLRAGEKMAEADGSSNIDKMDTGTH
jgi:hypothetical protein